jgi:hypothetical protein
MTRSRPKSARYPLLLYECVGRCRATWRSGSMPAIPWIIYG